MPSTMSAYFHVNALLSTLINLIVHLKQEFNLFLFHIFVAALIDNKTFTKCIFLLDVAACITQTNDYTMNLKRENNATKLKLATATATETLLS